MNRLATQLRAHAGPNATKPLNLTTKAFAHFFDSLNNKNIKYIAVGHLAAAFYGCLKVCSTIELWIESNEENIQRLNKVQIDSFNITLKQQAMEESFSLKVIKDLGFFKSKNFSWCYDKSEEANVSGVIIPILAMPDLIIEKTKSNEPEDMELAEELENLLLQ